MPQYSGGPTTSAACRSGADRHSELTGLSRRRPLVVRDVLGPLLSPVDATGIVAARRDQILPVDQCSIDMLHGNRPQHTSACPPRPSCVIAHAAAHFESLPDRPHRLGYYDSASHRARTWLLLGPMSTYILILGACDVACMCVGLGELGRMLAHAGWGREHDLKFPTSCFTDQGGEGVNTYIHTALYV